MRLQAFARTFVPPPPTTALGRVSLGAADQGASVPWIVLAGAGLLLYLVVKDELRWSK